MAVEIGVAEAEATRDRNSLLPLQAVFDRRYAYTFPFLTVGLDAVIPDTVRLGHAEGLSTVAGVGGRGICSMRGCEINGSDPGN